MDSVIYISIQSVLTAQTSPCDLSLSSKTTMTTRRLCSRTCLPPDTLTVTHAAGSIFMRRSFPPVFNRSPTGEGNAPLLPCASFLRPLLLKSARQFVLTLGLDESACPQAMAPALSSTVILKEFLPRVGRDTGECARTGVCKSLRNLVGPRGFEPRTSCTPSKRASQAAPRPEPFYFRTRARGRGASAALSLTRRWRTSMPPGAPGRVLGRSRRARYRRRRSG